MKTIISVYKFKRRVFNILSAAGVEVADMGNVLDACDKASKEFSSDAERRPFSVAKEIIEDYNC